MPRSVQILQSIEGDFKKEQLVIPITVRKRIRTWTTDAFSKVDNIVILIFTEYAQLIKEFEKQSKCKSSNILSSLWIIS
jgi:hypothetical protein